MGALTEWVQQKDKKLKEKITFLKERSNHIELRITWTDFHRKRNYTLLLILKLQPNQLKGINQVATTTGFPYFPTIMSVREEGGGVPY